MQSNQKNKRRCQQRAAREKQFFSCRAVFWPGKFPTQTLIRDGLSTQTTVMAAASERNENELLLQWCFYFMAVV